MSGCGKLKIEGKNEVFPEKRFDNETQKQRLLSFFPKIRGFSVNINKESHMRKEKSRILQNRRSGNTNERT
jgi:hypothetical protein